MADPSPEAIPYARFLTQTNQFVASEQQHRVTFRAFMPPPNLRHSVFRIDGLAEGEIKAVGQVVADNRNKNVYGYAAFPRGMPDRHGLQLVPDEPPPRHENIEGWPAEKGKWKALATLLADDAELELKGDPWLTPTP